MTEAGRLGHADVCRRKRRHDPTRHGQEFTALWLEFMPYVPEGGTEKDYRNIKIFMCPSYPIPKNTLTRQVVTYVVNAWDFRSAKDNVGYEQLGMSKVTRFRSRPTRPICWTTNMTLGDRLSPGSAIHRRH